jgi:hypothetical protein
LLKQKNLFHKLYSYTLLDRFATYPCKKQARNGRGWNNASTSQIFFYFNINLLVTNTSTNTLFIK